MSEILNTNEIKENFDSKTIPFHSLKNEDTKIPLNIITNDKEYIILVDVCGIAKEDISLELIGKTLRITCHRTIPISTKLYKTEIEQGDFFRFVELDDYVDSENIKATLKDGLLTIEIPKKTIKVDIQIN